MISVSIEKLLSVAFLVPMGDPSDAKCHWGLNVFLWGDPGIGKSKRVEMAAAMANLPARVVYAATSQPEDVSGVAIPDGAGQITIHALLPGVKHLITDKQGVLFLDELSCARPAVQAAFLGVCLTKRIADQELPPRVRIVAAGNPPESAAGGWDLTPPMANRFCHVVVGTPSATDWSEWLLKGSTNVPQVELGEERVRDGWGLSWARTQGLMAGFMRKSGDKMLFNLPKEGDARGRAWPSPRTWEWVARIWATASCLGEKGLVPSTLIEGCVGPGAATAFLEYAAKADLPDPIDMLENGWEPDKKRLDRTYAAYTGMVSYLKSLNKEACLAAGPGAWKCLQQGIDAGLIDIIVLFAKELCELKLTSKVSDTMKNACAPVYMALARSGISLETN